MNKFWVKELYVWFCSVFVLMSLYMSIYWDAECIQVQKGWPSDWLNREWRIVVIIDWLRLLSWTNNSTSVLLLHITNFSSPFSLRGIKTRLCYSRKVKVHGSNLFFPRSLRAPSLSRTRGGESATESSANKASLAKQQVIRTLGNQDQSF